MACTQINPGIQVGTQDKDFGAISLNQSLVSSVAQANKQAVLQWFWFAGFGILSQIPGS